MKYSFSGHYAPADLTELYKSNGLLAKIVDMPAEDASGADFSLEGISAKAVEYYERQLELLQWESTAETALKWQRLFGGALIVVLADDGGRIEQPLKLQTVRQVDGLLVFDSSQIIPRINQEGRPESFTISTDKVTFEAHPTRCLAFCSDPLPEHTDSSVTAFFGRPLYVRINRALSDVYTAHGAGVRAMETLSKSVYRLSGLSALLSTERGERELLNRMEALDLSRGLLSTVVIGEGDSYTTAPPPADMTEIAGLIDSSWDMLSAVTGIPEIILTGKHIMDDGSKNRSPFKRTKDESAHDLYESFIRDIQVKQIKKPLRRLLKIIGRAGIAAGALEELEPVRIKFNPLYSAPPLEAASNELKEAQAELTRARTIGQYVRAGVFTPDEAKKIIREEQKPAPRTAVGPTEQEARRCLIRQKKNVFYQHG